MKTSNIITTPDEVTFNRGEDATTNEDAEDHERNKSDEKRKWEPTKSTTDYMCNNQWHFKWRC